MINGTGIVKIDCFSINEFDLAIRDEIPDKVLPFVSFIDSLLQKNPDLRVLATAIFHSGEISVAEVESIAEPYGVGNGVSGGSLAFVRIHPPILANPDS